MSQSDPTLPRPEQWQDSLFLQGYQMCRMKEGKDFIAHALPGTEEYRKELAGWNSGLYELGLLAAPKRI